MPEDDKRTVVVKMVLCPDCTKETEFGPEHRRCKHCDFPLATHYDLERVSKVREKTRKTTGANGETKKSDRFNPLAGDIFE
jgi:predicted amidophosphoribosyltransferase